MLLLLLEILIALSAIVIAFGLARTWQVGRDPLNAAFRAGIVPSPALDGPYHGSVPGHTVSWLGKKMNAADNAGINVFTDGDKYPFATSVGAGLRDTDIQVLKIQYDVPGNPWWLRLVLDEMVQVAPGKYLGKVNLQIVPGMPFTIGYFRLEK
jgi:hypothetical protein